MISLCRRTPGPLVCRFVAPAAAANAKLQLGIDRRLRLSNAYSSATTSSSTTTTTNVSAFNLLRTHLPQPPEPQPRPAARRVYQTLSSPDRFASRLSLTNSPHQRASPSPRSQPLRARSALDRIHGKMAIGTTQTTRSHGGHSHSHHHHHHDNAYLTSQNKNDAGVRITRIGLYSNLGMAIAKGVGGYAFNSQAMVADAWHSLTDLASDVLTLATVSWSLKPPTANFPLGFGKVESLGSLGVSSMLLFGGLFMCVNSCESLYAHFLLDPAAAQEMLEHGHHHGHSHSHAHVGPSLHAAWLAAGTVAIKEWLYHATMKVARERKSSVLASNAVHHRVDSWTGIVTLAVILGANFMANAQWLDSVGGLIISLLVIRAGWGNTLSSLYELADKSIDDEVKASVRKQVHKGLAGVSSADQVELRDVSGVKSGQNYLVDLELAVPSLWTVADVREVEDAVRTRVGGKVRGVKRVRVRFVGKEDAPAEQFDEFIPGSVSQKSSPEPEEDNNNNNNNNNNNQDHTNGNGTHPKSQ